jgi:hypothetical protein
LFFHFVGDPINYLLVDDVFEFNTDMTSVAFLEMVYNIPQAGCTQANQVACLNGLIKIFFSKSKS